MRPFLTSFLILIPLTGFIFLFREIKGFQKKLNNFQKKTSLALQQTESLVQELYLISESKLPEKSLPSLLSFIPFADDQGIVLSSKTIDIEGVAAPYNASLLKEGENYYLFFRYDTPKIYSRHIPFYTNIACVQLDSHFQAIEPYFTLDTKSLFSEDPRALFLGGNCYIAYNDAVEDQPKKRGISLAEVNLKKKEISSIRKFNTRKFSVEKNWIPFAPDEKNLHFVYTVSPHEVCLADDSPQLKEVVDPRHCRAAVLTKWSENWGNPRGGTPPQLVEEEYLSFFHSMFKDHRGFSWYVMGAYTFEKLPPYRITRMSPYPILFKGVFSSPHKNTANPKVRCIYPSGLALETREGKKLIHLSCGENDSSIKILTLDREALMNSLEAIPKADVSRF